MMQQNGNKPVEEILEGMPAATSVSRVPAASAEAAGIESDPLAGMSDAEKEAFYKEQAAMQAELAGKGGQADSDEGDPLAGLSDSEKEIFFKGLAESQGVKQAESVAEEAPAAEGARIGQDVTATNKALPSANPEAPAQSDAQHTQDVSEMFGRMAKWYDLQNRAFSLCLDCWWRRNLVRSVVPGPTKHVIDMAAGTLDVSLALLRRYPELRVTATDISEPMLRYGEQKKVRASERDRISTMVADARSMPLPDGCADAVTIAFGIRNVRPRMEALREMHRLLVPGGRACILEFAPVSTPVFGPVYHWYLKNVMPKLAGLVSRSTNAFDYFAETIETFPKPDDFSAELREAGFEFVQHIPFTLGVANIHIAVRG